MAVTLPGGRRSTATLPFLPSSGRPLAERRVDGAEVTLTKPYETGPLGQLDFFLGVAYVLKSALPALSRSDDGRGAGLIGYGAATLVTHS